MSMMTSSKFVAGSLRNTALALGVAGMVTGALAAPALAQESVTTTRTTTYYDQPASTTRTTTYYSQPAYYYDPDGNTYTYPPAPAYAVPAPPPAPIAGVSVGVPGFGVQLGF